MTAKEIQVDLMKFRKFVKSFFLFRFLLKVEQSLNFNNLRAAIRPKPHARFQKSQFESSVVVVVK